MSNTPDPSCRPGLAQGASITPCALVHLLRCGRYRGLSAACLALSCAGSPPADVQPPPQRAPAVERTEPVGVPLLLPQLRHEPRGVSVTAVSRDARLAASGGRDQVVKVWDLPSGRLRLSFPVEDWVVQLAFAPAGDRLLALVDGEDHDTVRAIDLATGKALYQFTANTQQLDGFAFSADGLQLLTESPKVPPQLWDLATGQLVIEQNDPHWTPAERISCPFDAVDSPWAKPSPPKTCGTGEREVLRAGKWVPMQFSSNAAANAAGLKLTSRGYQAAKHAQLWQAGSAEPLFSFDAHQNVVSVALSADGKIAYTAGTARVDTSQQANVMAWNTQTGALLQRYALEEMAPSIGQLTLAHDQRRVVLTPQSARYSEVGEVWDLVSGEVSEAHANWPKQAEFNANRALAFTEDKERRVAIAWDTQTGARLYELSGHTSWLRSITLNATASRVLTTSGDGTARLWDAKSGALLHVLQHDNEVMAGAFDADSSLLATCSWDDTARLWDAASGQLLHTFQHPSDVFSVHFDAGRLLTSGASIELWDVASRKKLHSFASKGRASSVSFAAGGRAIAALSGDALRLWDAASGALLHELPVERQEHLAVLSGAESRAKAGSPQSFVLTAGRELSVHRFDADLKYTGSVTLSRLARGLPQATPPWLPPYERLTVTTPNGLFDGDPRSFAALAYRLGSDTGRAPLLAGEQLAVHLHRPGLLNTFWSGQALALPQEVAAGVGLPPTVEVTPSETTTASEALKEAPGQVQLSLRLHSNGGGVSRFQLLPASQAARFADALPVDPASFSRQAGGQRFSYPGIGTAQLRPGRSEYQLVAWNERGAVRSQAVTLSLGHDAICGNGVLEAGETCDDGNTHSQDGCSRCRREAVARLGSGLLRLADGSVGCLHSDPHCKATQRYAAGLSVGVTHNLQGSGFVSDSAQLIAPHLPHALRSESIAAVSDGDCVATKSGQLWCRDPKYPYFPSQACPFNGFVPQRGPSVGHQHDWCQVQRPTSTGPEHTGAVLSVSGNISRGCALLAGGAVECWGDAMVRQGSGPAERVELPQGRGARAVAVGAGHTCVLTDSGEVGCWGNATQGQLGYVGKDLNPYTEEGEGDDGLWEPHYAQPTPPQRFMTFSPPAKAIFAHENASCALLENGQLWCWGLTSLLPRSEYAPERYTDNVVNPKLSSTLPSRPVALAAGCAVTAVDLEQACVACANSCLRCVASPADGVATETAVTWPSECLVEAD